MCRHYCPRRAVTRLDSDFAQAVCASRADRRADALVVDDLPLRCSARVLRVVPPANAPEWAAWLTEIGFLPGEVVMVLTRHRPGGDPLAVRVGDSTFALRRAEAACIEVELSAAIDDRDR